MNKCSLAFVSVWLLLLIVKCDYCSFIHGEEALGSRFMLINEDKDRIYILYCYGNGCCKSGKHVVPSKVTQVSFNQEWIIAKTINQEKESYWIVNKIRGKDIGNCQDKVECDKVIKSAVIGPMDEFSFNEKKNALNVELSFDK